MREDVVNFLLRQVYSLATRDIETLVTVFRAPLPIFHPNGRVLNASEDDVRASLQVMMSEFEELNIADVKARLLDMQTKPGSVTIGCLMEYLYLDDAGQAVKKTVAWYYVEPEGNTYKIVMMNYDEAAFPAIFSRFDRVIPLPDDED